MKVYEAFQQREWEWAYGAPVQGDVLQFDGRETYFLALPYPENRATLWTMRAKATTKCGEMPWNGTPATAIRAFGDRGDTARYAEGFPHMGIKQGRPVFQRGCLTVLRRGLVVRHGRGMVYRIVQWRDGKSFFLQIVSEGGLPPGILMARVEEREGNSEGVLTEEVCRKLGIWDCEIVSFGE